MCVGIPMQVVEAGFGQARCRNGAQEEIVDTQLVGALEPGDWVMVFLGAARERISEEFAKQCRDALSALDIVMKGGTDFEHLFADLIDREPELPDFLRPETQAASTARTTNSGAK